jgi:hypothetical protein
LEGASDECELDGRRSLRGDLSRVRCSLVEVDEDFLVECDGRVLRSLSLSLSLSLFSLSRFDRGVSLSLSLSLSRRSESVFRRSFVVVVPNMMLHGLHHLVIDRGGSRDLWLD